MTLDYDLRIKTHSDGLYNEFDCLELTTLENGKKCNQLHVDLKKLLNNVNAPNDAILLEYCNKKITRVPNENTEKVLTFGYRKSLEFLTEFFQDLDDQMPFLDTRTKVADCVRIMTSPNLELVNEKIYLACHTNEFKYIIEYLRRFFKYLTNANIERSGIFISNKGNPITANCLYNSKTQKLHTKPIIDAIIHRLSVKYC